jgi:hypothetical protein
MGGGSGNEQEDGPVRPTTLEHQHEGTRKYILTQTLTEEFTRVLLERVRMILPQVHLRKPCYDFSFL